MPWLANGQIYDVRKVRFAPGTLVVDGVRIVEVAGVGAFSGPRNSRRARPRRSG
jgi:hypothetical protein